MAELPYQKINTLFDRIKVCYKKENNPFGMAELPYQK
jgi:hypothetical protein